MAGKNEANLADKKTPEKPKHGQYKERECPHCHAMTRNLGNHINKDKSNDKKEDSTGNIRGDNYPAGGQKEENTNDNRGKKDQP